MHKSASGTARKSRLNYLFCCFVFVFVIGIVVWRLAASQSILLGSKYGLTTSAKTTTSLFEPQAKAPQAPSPNVDLNDINSLLNHLDERLNDLHKPLASLQKQIDKIKPRTPSEGEGLALGRNTDHTGEETIFVNIASFRDEECPPTLRDMFLKARAPWRVFVGILQQNDQKDPPCWPVEWYNCSKDVFCASDQVRIRHIDHKDAKGPTYGRYLADQMYRGEKYYFLMDSHNRFVKHWDDLIIKILKKAPTYPKAVLSHYPEALLLDGSDPKPLDNRDTTTFMCNAKFIGDGYLRFDGAVVHKTTIPRLQPYAAAGMLFGLATMFKEVPFDPHLPFLFDGEEILYSVRMWTHGYDIYSPNENVMYHFYYRSKSEKVWSVPGNNWYHWQRRSVERVQYFLGVTHTNTTNRVIPVDTTTDYIVVEADKYGLGTARPIEEFWKFAGVDTVQRTATSWCNRA